MFRSLHACGMAPSENKRRGGKEEGDK